MVAARATTERRTATVDTHGGDSGPSARTWRDRRLVVATLKAGASRRSGLGRTPPRDFVLASMCLQLKVGRGGAPSRVSRCAALSHHMMCDT